MRTLTKICGFAFVMFLNMSVSKYAHTPNIEHHVRVIHPGVSMSLPVERTLVEVKDPQNNTVEFYMNVETVLCSDSQCIVDVVKIYWDTLGFFNRLELPENVYLEKAEGKHFNVEDSEKLNSILANKKCSLKDMFSYEVVGTESSDGVDGISGATIILNTNDYVKGAVWTCYTLWHWANGDVYTIIRNITGDGLESTDFISLCKYGNEVDQIFSIEQLIRRKSFDEKSTDQVIQLVSKADDKLTKSIITYFEKAPIDSYYTAVELALQQSNLLQRKSYYNSIINYQIRASLEFYERLFTNLDKWVTYDEINSLLSLIATKQISSSKIIRSVLPLLDHSDFVIARRAYWFLSESEFPHKDSIRINEFYKSNLDRL